MTAQNTAAGGMAAAAEAGRHRGCGFARAGAGRADELAELAAAVARLRPDWQQPERFYERRSDLAARLRRLADQAQA